MADDSYDVCVVGAGVSGCATARELSRLDCRVVVLERGSDVCSGTSKANSAIVHAGFDAEPGTLMAQLNVEGNRMMGPLCEKLDVPFHRIGSLVVCTDEEQLPQLEELRRRGVRNGVPDLEVVGRDRLHAVEPYVSDAACGALWAPTAGIVDPFLLTIALAENAADNGAEFRLGAEVRSILREPGGWAVRYPGGCVHARCVVNAAGVHAGEVHGLASALPLEIVPRKGEYLLLDKRAGTHVRHTVFCLPGRMGKGILVTPTVHGNLLLGPTATDVPDGDDTATTACGMDAVVRGAARTVRDIPVGECITTFAGLRAHRPEHEFLIAEAPDAPGFVDCAGIESPGLTASPAIGRRCAGIVADLLGLRPKDAGAVVVRRHGTPHVAQLGWEERAALIAREPAYGHVVCRCEQVSEGEILDAIHRTLGARDLDGVKRRVRCGMGRCQGGFCTPKVMEILAREVPGLTLEQVSKLGPGSELIVGHDKDAYAAAEEGERA